MTYLNSIDLLSQYQIAYSQIDKVCSSFGYVDGVSYLGRNIFTMITFFFLGAIYYKITH